MAGKAPSESEIPALLDRLDPPDEPKVAATKTKRKSGNRRRKPKPALTAPQPVNAQSVSEIREIGARFFKTNPDKKKEEPFLLAFVEPKPLAPIDEVFRPLIRNFLLTCPAEKRKAMAETISNVAAALADTEFSDVSDPLNSSSILESQAPRADVSGLPSSEMKAEPSLTPAAKPPAKARRKLILDDDNDVFQGVDAVGGRKPVASEVTTHEASVSLVS